MELGNKRSKVMRKVKGDEIDETYAGRQILTFFSPNLRAATAS